MTTGLARAGFDGDLAQAHCDEETLGKLLQHARTTKWELKTDRLFQGTGNFFVEMYQKGRPGGLLTSEADYQVFEYLGGRYLFLPTEHVRSIVNGKRLVRGGDYNLYQGVLCNILWLLR